ncbi:hypothetical protein ACT3TI_12910 [Psychrobacter sp. AOP22-C1-22]|jgi:hypothetical protein|uniref:hypothetical protein n=1 Tax=Psychrobacter TaxID=497 RepID=UPI00078E8BE8|nr:MULTISPECIES: hypothetical protein [Psychrobacter]AMN69025.1 hypothetical protein AK825_14300 [Psychrobacter sp. P11G5]MBE0407737.1 hypothetical protein [Psychrobacter sp. FME6]SJN18930.1 hypothetical protein CZ794_02070 [Psychrobacter sp. JB385]
MGIEGVSVASNHFMMFEEAQREYYRQMGRLNTFGLENESHSDSILKKMFELKDEESMLREYSASELYVIQKELEQKIDDFLRELDE